MRYLVARVSHRVQRSAKKNSKMPLCAVLTCKSKTDGPDGPTKGVTFHHFPADEEVKSKWVDMTGRDNWIPTSTSVVCSKHFRDTDYIIKRSGNRYLKTAAIPCEYVVYRHLFPDEEPIPSPASQTSEDRETTATPSTTGPSSPQTQSSPTPTPTPAVTGPSPAPTQEADTTSYNEDFNDMNDNTIGWDQFQTLGHFGRGEAASILKRRQSEVDSSAPADLEHSINKFKRMELIRPLDLSPALDEPRSSVEEPHTSMMEPSQSIALIRKVMSKRKSSKKTSSATATAVAREALQIQLQLEAGNLNELEKADAIIQLQHKQLINSTVVSRGNDKMFNEIDAILRNTK